MKKLNIYLILGIILLITSILFIGIFRDDEFYELNFLIKNRPSLKNYFFSPIGMSDLTINDLSVENQNEEIAFVEFVNHRNRQLDFLPIFIIQLTLTSLTFGFYKLQREINFKIWYPFIHYSINFIFTLFGIVFILSVDSIIFTFTILALILTINYYSIILISKKLNKQKSYVNVKTTV